MFKKEHFSLWKAPQYPAFFRIVQSIHSPLLGNSKIEESPYTSLITFGLWQHEIDKLVKGISICSVLHSKKIDHITLISHIKLMKDDYLNKSLKRSDSYRPANEMIFERKSSEKSVFPLHGKIKDYSFFFPDRNGGDDINDRLMIALPLCKKVYLTKNPDGDGLRATDKYFVEMLGSFPGVESYSLAAALIQGLIYCDRRWLR